MSLTCWICEEHERCPFPICYEQERVSKQLEKEWDEQQALTQKDIEEIQLELGL